MQIVSCTMVKDEEKIIESFVRYNSCYFDKMIIVDNGCTDKTMDIVWQLKEEGYPLEIYNESYIDFEVAMMENKYLRLAANNYNADWIVPLDADEFFYTKTKNDFEKLSKDAVYYINWKTYALQDGDDLYETCIPKRITHVIKKRGVEEVKVTKVIISGELVRNTNLCISAGHHEVIGYENKDVVVLTNMYVAHFPIISKEQMFTKINGSYNNFIPWTTRGGDGIHINRHKLNLESGQEDIDFLTKGG